MPVKARPIEAVSVQSPASNDKRRPVVGGKRKRYVEWHPVPNKVKAVDQDRVPGKFPTSA